MIEYSVETIIDRIQQACAKNGVTINKMGIESGAGKSAVDNIKKGSMPASDKLAKMADYLHCSVDYLLGCEEPIRQNQSDNTPLAGLSENARRIVELFEDLTPTQQGEIIGRAALLAEQNEVEYIKGGA